MNQFEVWDYDFEEKGGAHPCVLISHPDFCARSKYINVLYCTSQRQNRSPYETEVLLTAEDGFNWETFCDCSLMWVVDRRDLSNRRGPVTLERRRQIRSRLRDLFLLQATD